MGRHITTAMTHALEILRNKSLVSLRRFGRPAGGTAWSRSGFMRIPPFGVH